MLPKRRTGSSAAVRCNKRKIHNNIDVQPSLKIEESKNIILNLMRRIQNAIMPSILTFRIFVITALIVQTYQLSAQNAYLVKDIYPNSSSSNPRVLSKVGGNLFFSAKDGNSGVEPWKSDGTANGTTLVKDICNILSGYADSEPGMAADFNGLAFFSATNGINGFELWKSDGTASGTSVVKDIFPGDGDADPFDLTPVNNWLYFTAKNGSNNRELWRTDGTNVGTSLFADIWAGVSGSNPDYLTNVNGVLYYTANNGTNGTEIWRTDGTVFGTYMVKDIYPGNSSSSPGFLTNLNGTLLFLANDGINGTALWKSDGTENGTTLVKSILYDIGGEKIVMNGLLFFVVGGELWKSDGTTAGTVLVKDIFIGNQSSKPRYLTAANGILYFSAIDGNYGTELWRSDGTEAGTFMVKDINPGSLESIPQELVNVNGTLYFSAISPYSSSSWIWKSDGTEAGTTMITLPIAPYAYIPTRLTAVNHLLFFTLQSSGTGEEIWAINNGMTSIKIIESSKTIQIQPNLAQNYIAVTYLSQEPLKYVITDSMGHIFKNGIAQNGSSIEVGELNPGLYLFITGLGTTKFVISRF